MIYLDNAATTFPKPASVNSAVSRAMRMYGANPGRSGHKMSISSAEEIYKCRKAIAKLFNFEDESNIVFTLNCTQCVNMVLKGILKPGDHAVVSCLEHNAVMRPVKKLNDQGINFTIANIFPGDDEKTLDSFRKSLNERTKLIVCMHASNVWGIKLPIERISAMGRQYGIPTMVDAAQSAGVIPIDLTLNKIDFLCMAGHKGLMGPMGTGVLIVRNSENLNTIIEGGTGTGSQSLYQPETMPDKLESGTPNMPGIAGLRAGVEFINRTRVNRIFKHEFDLIVRLYDKLSKIKCVKLYTNRPDPEHCVPLLSFNIKGKDSEMVADFLNKEGIAVRAGMHCAPLAHNFYNTLETGAIRVCPSYFTKTSDIDYFVMTIKRFEKKYII